jgi:hypothetical protein
MAADAIVLSLGRRSALPATRMVPSLLLVGSNGHPYSLQQAPVTVMDMVFRDDECIVRTNHAPANFTTIKHMALNLLRRPAGKQSLRGRRKAASWDDDFLVSLLAA